MKPELQIKALAELANLKYDRIEGSRLYETIPQRGSPDDDEQLLIDFNSYDAIIPLIQKQSRAVKELICANTWWTEFGTDISDMVNMLEATPAELCEALLRATGKWTD